MKVHNYFASNDPVKFEDNILKGKSIFVIIVHRTIAINLDNFPA
jgi:hypothetical protein